ncbi:hypothetical protein AVEN_175832-1 [Araneus ventricosus]|uniref:Uncharacterized protein n=1 Tax=Araneus ventricosus TaxID=182803 RepID=A0A4Y2F125_ARAVE|nr:hypothetical protein AVEN_175832-1 [Araneus ventricosus]
MLSVKFQNEDFVVKQAEECADYLIMKSTLEIEKRSRCVVVVGEDIDLLVIIAASTNSENIFFLKPGRVFLPPTTAAAREHSLRAYPQVQHWSGYAKRPLDWCWKETKHGLFSVTTHKEPASPALLSMISLQVRKRVNLTCTCRKSGIECSTICYHYKGQGCTNSLEDSIITNLAKQEAEIDIRMEEIILEVDLEEEYQELQVVESDRKQTDINDYD